MTAVFSAVIENAIVSAVVIAVIVVLRVCFLGISRRFSLLLWSAAALRLILPFDFRIPAFFTTQTAGSGLSVLSGAAGVIRAAADAANAVSADAFPNEVAAGASFSAFDALAYIWLGGIAVVLLFGLEGWIFAKKQVREAVKLEKDIRMPSGKQCDVRVGTCVKTPFSTGFIHPVIYLPAGLSDSETDAVILHEQTHIMRRDGIKRLIAYLISSVYWFSLPVWAAYELFCADTEYTCDEDALRRATASEKQKYSAALLGIACGKNFGFTPTPLFGSGNIKTRIKRIMCPKNGKNVAVLSVAAVVCVFAVAAAAVIRVEKTVDISDIYGSVFHTEPPSLCYADKNKVIIENPEIGVAVYDLNKEKFTDRITYKDKLAAGIDYMSVVCADADGNTIYFADLEGKKALKYSLSRRRFYPSSDKEVRGRNVPQSKHSSFVRSSNEKAVELRENYNYSVLVTDGRFYFLCLPKYGDEIFNLDRTQLITGYVEDMSDIRVYELFPKK